jgi:dethiobiotin synthetase
VTCLAVIGTDTGVGKTWTALLLVRGLRRAGHRAWIHKPVACGGWVGGPWPSGTAEDARVLAQVLGDGQDPASLCPRQYPGAMSPHLAAAMVDTAPTIAELCASVPQADGIQTVVETAGGLLSPIAAARATNADLLRALACPAILVTRPHLGTLNHTALTVAAAAAAGIPLVGLVICYAGVDADLAATPAVATAPAELAAITRLPVIAQIPHDSDDDGPFARWVRPAR